MQRDPKTGALGPVLHIAPTRAPSYVAVHPRLPVLYAANELPEGTVTAFAITAEGPLTAIGEWPTGGSSPCHIAVDPDGHMLAVANYVSGNVTAIRLDDAGVPVGHRLVGHSGQGPHPERQASPHAHMVVPVPAGVLAVDLGTDAVYRHPVDGVTGDLIAGEPVVRLPPGTGPRHLVVDPAGRLHIVGELSATVASYDAAGSLVASTPTTTASEAYPSGIVGDADGRFLYVANRGPNTVSVIAIGGPRPALVGEVPAGGSWPRDVMLVEPYLYVANERSDTVGVFHIDPVTGMPSPTGDMFATPTPTCVVAYPVGQ